MISFYLASLFTGAPQVVYRSVIILGGINCNNKSCEVSEIFVVVNFVFVFVIVFVIVIVSVFVFVFVLVYSHVST